MKPKLELVAGDVVVATKDIVPPGEDFVIKEGTLGEFRHVYCYPNEEVLVYWDAWYSYVCVNPKHLGLVLNPELVFEKRK